MSKRTHSPCLGKRIEILMLTIFSNSPRDQILYAKYIGSSEIDSIDWRNYLI